MWWHVDYGPSSARDGQISGVICHAGAPEWCLLQAEDIPMAGLFSLLQYDIPLRNVPWSFRANINLLGL